MKKTMRIAAMMLPLASAPAGANPPGSEMDGVPGQKTEEVLSAKSEKNNSDAAIRRQIEQTNPGVYRIDPNMGPIETPNHDADLSKVPPHPNTDTVPPKKTEFRI